MDTAGTAIGGPLTTQLQQESTNPQGYSPQQLAYMNTASQQSLGGGVAGVTGEANLEAARTRNAGGFSGAIGTATRNAQKSLSENAVNIQVQQAQLQQQQKQDALKQLMQLYGIDEQTALSYLNSSNSALGAENANSGFKNSIVGDLLGHAVQGVATGLTTRKG